METTPNISPWDEIDSAFSPMFDEAVSIRTPDGKRTTCRVAIFSDGISEPLTDEAMDTDREDLTFVFCKTDWPFVRELSRGAIITRTAFGKEYAVAESKLDNLLGWVVIAREK